MFFGKGKEKGSTEPQQMSGFIGKGVNIEGRLSFDGSVRIDGDFKGEIDAEGLLIVGEGALIEANITVGSAVICGEVKGDIDAKTKVELKSPAHIQGNIRTQSIVIEDGVIFEGNCIMKGRKEEKIALVEKQEEETRRMGGY